MTQRPTAQETASADPADPFALFAAWFAEAEANEPELPNAVALATVGADGRPSLRMVLLKGVDATGFVFYTNADSRKGRDMQANPHVALLFHWKSLHRQIRIEGPAAAVTDAEADAYFASRPRAAQIGAWASDQSRPLAGRFDLEKRIAVHTARFAVGRIPRPPHWKGYRVQPVRFEFWNEGRFRLHDRLTFERNGTGWRTERLFP